MPWPVWLSALLVTTWFLRDWRYPEVIADRVDGVVHLYRGQRSRRQLWLVFDPERDRVLSRTERGNYARGDDYTLIVAEVRGCRVRFKIEDDRLLGPTT